jgi:RNA polymerase sigma factor for flagellar operon FliA
MNAMSDDQTKLVERYREYADALAMDILRSLPKFVRAEDVTGAARQGLVESVTRFDPTRGVQFTTFAYYRIRGAVFDWVKGQIHNDPYHIARMAATRALDSVAESAVEGVKSASPAETQQVSVQALGNLLDTAVAAFTISEAAAFFQPDTAPESPETHLAESESAAYVRRAIETLPDKERTMLQRVYFESETIEAAGASLGLSKSWASRLHARALSMMREKLGEEYAT